MISAACWNIRGLHFTHKQDEVKALVSIHHLSLLGLLETKVKSPTHMQLARSLLPGWKFLFNYSSHRLGRIWVAWDPAILSISLLLSSTQLIHVSIKVLETNQEFLASYVYGLNEDAGREALWHSIKTVASSDQEIPWVVLGDFNIVRFINEKLGGSISWSPAMDSFNDCCYEATLDDLPFSGHFLTWSNKSSSSRQISRKLDREIGRASCRERVCQYV